MRKGNRNKGAPARWERVIRYVGAVRKAYTGLHIVFGYLFAHHHLGGGGWLMEQTWTNYLLAGVGVVIMLGGIIEFFWRRSNERNLQLREERLQQEIADLKSMIEGR